MMLAQSEKLQPVKARVKAAEVPRGGSEQDQRERRSGDRFRTVFRVAKVACESVTGLWHIRNISDRGMMLLTRAAISVGERLSVSLSDSIKIDGKVAWFNDGKCGVEFDKPVNSARLLKKLVAERLDPSYRAPRLEVSVPAVAYCERGIHPVRVTDISQHGLGFTHDGCVQECSKILIVLENGLERRGIVRWLSGSRGGLQLLEPFTCAELHGISCG
jgi:hypothetical protein